MSKRVPTSVSSLRGVLAVLIVALVPAIASADSLLPVADTTIPTDGTSFSFSGQFAWDNDVAFFRFVLDQGGLYDLTASTTSWTKFEGSGFDPVLSLYAAADLHSPMQLYAYPGLEGVPVGAIFDDVDPAADENLTVDLNSALSLRLGGGAYILALSQALNYPHEDFTFDWDNPDSKCTVATDEDAVACPQLVTGGTAAYAGVVQITPVDTTPVPEPGTLSLMALGSLATACLRRRRRTVVTTPE